MRKMSARLGSPLKVATIADPSGVKESIVIGTRCGDCQRTSAAVRSSSAAQDGGSGRRRKGDACPVGVQRGLMACPVEVS
jgi:hypothetical protein